MKSPRKIQKSQQAIQHGIQYYHSGNMMAAEACFREAAHTNPDSFDAHYSLGVVLIAQNKHADAIRPLRRATNLNPRSAEALNNLAICLQTTDQNDEAIAYYQRAISVDTKFINAYSNLAQCLVQRGRSGDAVDVCNRAIQIRSDYADIYNMLGIAYREQGKLEEARDAYERAIQLNPHDYKPTYNLAIVLQNLGELDTAISHYRQALALNPANPDIQNNLGAALQEFGKPDEARAYFERALQLRPDYPQAHFNYALNLLLNGEFDKGWPEYEWRWQGSGELKSKQRQFSMPMWDGGDAQGATILIHTEQGFGDSLQFIRYVTLVATRSAKIILQCPENLVRLFQRVKEIDSVISNDDALPEFDLHCPLLSLPLLFKTKLATIPNSVPYLSAYDADVKRWQEKLGVKNGLRVGLVWSGGFDLQTRGINKRRNLSSVLLEPLAHVQGIQLYSLQKGAAAQEIQTGNFRLLDYTDMLTDFADTAALIENLDLVISVDTSVAHLTGALGKPIWLLCRYDSEWRWLRDRNDSPWYPTMRLFRQPQPGKWDAVISDMQIALYELSMGEMGKTAKR